MPQHFSFKSPRQQFPKLSNNFIAGDQPNYSSSVTPSIAGVAPSFGAYF